MGAEVYSCQSASNNKELPGGLAMTSLLALGLLFIWASRGHLGSLRARRSVGLKPTQRLKR